PAAPVAVPRALNPVGPLIVRAHVVELRGRLIVDGRPRLAAVERHAGAPVVALDHAAGAARIDPEVVVVTVRRRHLREALAAVDGLPQGVVHHPQGVGVARIGDYVHVVPGPAAQARLLAAALPGLTAIVRTE